jgi:GTP-binding protein SAR1
MLWPAYFTAINAVVFVIDCMDVERFGQAADLLDGLLSNEKLTGVPFLILGNKAEGKTAASELQLRSAFRLTGRLTGKEPSQMLGGLPGAQRPVELFLISVFHPHGFRDGFTWMVQHIV